MFEVGQIVQIRSNRGGVLGYSRVKKVGKVRLTLENGEQYKVCNGREIGAGTFYYSFIVAK